MNNNQKLAVVIAVVLVLGLTVSGYFLIRGSRVHKNKYRSYKEMDVPVAPVEQDIESVEPSSDSDTSLFTVAEQMPEFPGGDEGMMQFLSKNLEYPTMAKEQGIQGKVWIGFVVEKNGVVKDVEVLRGIGGGCDEEAVRVIKKMPRWKPGRQGGRTVRVKYRLPINFVLE